MSTALYAPPRVINDRSDCMFYHTMDLPTLGTVQGQWDLRGKVDDYLGKIPLEGRRVLDVGTASGFLTFEMEKRGAKVVSFDADSSERITFLPFSQSRYVTHHAEWVAKHDKYLDSIKNAYWLAHRLNQSSAQVYYGDINHLPEALGQFDVVVVAQILIHLRDPLAALTQAAKLCARRLVIAEGTIPSNEPTLRLCGSLANKAQYAWFQLSLGLYKEFLAILGFKIIRISQASYSCQAEEHADLIPITTIVAERVDRTAEGCREQIQLLETLAEQYRSEIGDLPPAQNNEFFAALNGKNRLKKQYIYLDQWPHDGEGRGLDVWNEPYLIEILENKIKVRSATLEKNSPPV